MIVPLVTLQIKNV